LDSRINADEPIKLAGLRDAGLRKDLQPRKSDSSANSVLVALLPRFDLKPSTDGKRDWYVVTYQSFCSL
jgi:hypothetical protein